MAYTHTQSDYTDKHKRDRPQAMTARAKPNCRALSCGRMGKKERINFFFFFSFSYFFEVIQIARALSSVPCLHDQRHLVTGVSTRFAEAGGGGKGPLKIYDKFKKQINY